MVFVAGICAAFALGLGWVLQQRVASHAALSELLSFRLLLHLMRQRVWWAGIAAMIAGQALGGLAFQLGPVTLVEPLLSMSLLFAFVIAAFVSRHRAGWHEIAGAVLLSAALGVFIAVGNPRAGSHSEPSWQSIILATGIVAGVVVAIVAVAKRQQRLVVESVLIAAGAGVLYGLQDAATRGALLAIEQHGIAEALTLSPWPYVVIGSATIGLLLTQSAFRAARLDYSLPPTAAAEPIVGVALGVGVLGDQLSVSAGGLAVEAACLAAMLAGALLIARSPTLAAHADSQPGDPHATSAPAQ
ncbi:MAG: integral rane protein [Pseudonocardiales bacterium]|nr:integral rane protein [Pseudonocardiales bacterium]